MGINYHSQLTITGFFGPSAGFPPRKDSIRTNHSNSKPPNHQMPQTAVKLDESFDSNSLTMKENTSQNHSLDLVFHSIHSHSSIKSLLASNLISWRWSDMICRFVLQTRAISTFRWMQPLEINQMDLLFTTVWMNKRCYGSQRSNLKEKKRNFAISPAQHTPFAKASLLHGVRPHGIAADSLDLKQLERPQVDGLASTCYFLWTMNVATNQRMNHWSLV